MTSVQPYLHTAGSSFVDRLGRPVRLRGIGIGGWLNMENFITGFPANESLVRECAELFRGLGDDDPTALADSFALGSCAVREPLLSQLRDAA